MNIIKIMVNKKGGKGYKKGKKFGNGQKKFDLAEEEQTYARIVKKLGDRRFQIMLHSAKEKSMGRARGSLHGWHSLKPNDIVLVSGRDYRVKDTDEYVQNVYDIIGLYDIEQTKKLKKMGEITDPTFFENSSITAFAENDLDFADDDEEEEMIDIVEQPNRDFPTDESSDEYENVDDI